jgi:rSAM/selenodomain-associated transferase 2
VISVIIATLNEERFLPACMASLAGQAPHEVIVVDGGSRDGTVAVASAAGARMLVAPQRGRGPQLNHGAEAASGDALLFLHADARLPSGALERVDHVLAARREVVAGSFTLRFDNPALLYRFLAACGDLYHRFVPTLYGDRAIFVRRAAFVAAGGFRPLPIMEDVDLSDRLRRLGRRVVVRGPVISSARQFQRQGAVRLVGKIIVAVAAYRLRVSPRWIAKFYYGPQATTGGGP